MPGSRIGEYFSVINFGESHGPAIGCVIDGCPPGMELSPVSYTHLAPLPDLKQPRKCRIIRKISFVFNRKLMPSCRSADRILTDLNPVDFRLFSFRDRSEYFP